jgi:hypothetical protein
MDLCNSSRPEQRAICRSRRIKQTETAGTPLTSVEKSVHTPRNPEQTNRSVDKPFSCVLMHQGDLEKETTVNDANLRSGGSVPEWEGH